MNTAVHQLPMPAGMAVAPPMRRARTEMWSAPDPRAIVLDPWAPPRGQPIASMSLSPWPAPRATARIAWMAAPPAVLPPPAGLALPARSPDVDRALAALRALAAQPDSILAQPARPSGPAIDVAPAMSSTPLDTGTTETRTNGAVEPAVAPATVDAFGSATVPAPLRLDGELVDTLDRVGTIDPPWSAPAVDDRDQLAAEPSARWHVAAAVTAVGAAVAALVALLATLL